MRIPQQAISTNECRGLRGAVDFTRRPKKCLSENVYRGFGFGIKLRFTVRPYTEANKQTQSYEQQPRDTAGMRTRRPGTPSSGEGAGHSFGLHPLNSEGILYGTCSQGDGWSLPFPFSQENGGE